MGILSLIDLAKNPIMAKIINREIKKCDLATTLANNTTVVDVPVLPNQLLHDCESLPETFMYSTSNVL